MDQFITVTYYGGPYDGDVEDVDADRIRKMIAKGPIKVTVELEDTNREVECYGQYRLEKVNTAEYHYIWTTPKKGKNK